MAILNKAVVDKTPVFSGEGNQSVAIFKYTAAAGQIADVIYFGILPKYARVYNTTMINAALGASSTIALGYATAEVGGSLAASAAYFLAATATSSAAKTSSAAAAVPIQLSEACYVTGTIAGGAVTGDVYVIVEYLYESK